ncbi:Mediator of RNA polymerase II transcription subunit 18 [Meyerozyma guilliermondii]
MVHQLSLVSTVEHGYYVQTVATLKALTGLQSTQNIATYNLVTKPHDVFKPKVEAGKVNQIEQYYMKCITTWDEDTGDIEKPILKDSNTVEASRLFVGDNNKRIWTLQISDIPVAGKNQTCSAQTIYDSTLVHHHTKVVDKVEKENSDQFEFVRNDSFLQFLSDLGYDVINQFWLKGVRFFHGDIVIEIFKVFIRDDERQSSDNAIALKLLDESNTFQFKAYINVPKATDVDAINQGTKELLKLQDFLKNLVKLEIPDRIHMDSRVSK